MRKGPLPKVTMPRMARTVLTFAILFSILLPVDALTQTRRTADGWYLLIPPRSEFNERAEFTDGYKILDDKPFSQWAQQGAYDSASECESTRNKLLAEEHSRYAASTAAYVKAVGEKTDPVVLRLARFSAEVRNANVNAFIASRCIRSNDPRLLK